MTDRCFEWHSSRDLMNTSSSLSSIVNGRDAKRAELPYIVYIEEWIDNEINGRCTGTVLNQHWILTAAHCYNDCDSCLYKIYAGIIDIRYPGIDYGINRVIVHENNSRVNDLALINVKIPMNFSANNGFYRQINGICLPTIDQNNTDYEYAVIAGFGLTAGDERKSELQMGWIRINPIDPNDPNVLYAVTYPEPPNGTHLCNGDSGGPLIQYTNGRAVLIGVAVRVNGIFGLFIIGVCNVVDVVVGLQIGDYPDIINTTDCGIGRESQLMTDRCFEWHSSRDLMNTSSSLSSIVNGRDAKRAELPYIVYIEKWKDNDNTRCTGTVLNQHWILTAAHCYEECDNCLYKIYAGIIDIRYPGIDYGINRVIVHENNSAVNDLALINVKIPMNFSTNNGYYYRQINGICLPTIDQNNTDYEYAVIAGFGLTAGHERKSELQMGWIRINPINPNDPNMLYAVTYPEPPNGSHLCNGGGSLGGKMTKILEV
ncbi:uncharacterized protein LOC128954452 [Oppia nitens]|uniref:uncharacterized protein LOC128954452 n=1 Tax=Oppia nitens TaxID=1686743 RepID=UPI0023D989B1|nr:uncharacterized protein LOC128954452 [Oppia nitens]